MVATLPLRPSSSGRLGRQANASIRWVRVNTRSVMRQLFLRSVVSAFPFHLDSPLALILLGHFVNSVCNYPRALEALRLNARSEGVRSADC